jgi:hypothetical protein
MNSLYIWRQDKLIVAFSERSDSEYYAPEIAAEKIQMDLASCLNMKSWEAEEGHGGTFAAP